HANGFRGAICFFARMPLSPSAVLTKSTSSILRIRISVIGCAKPAGIACWCRTRGSHMLVAHLPKANYQPGECITTRVISCCSFSRTSKVHAHGRCVSRLLRTWHDIPFRFRFAEKKDDGN